MHPRLRLPHTSRRVHIHEMDPFGSDKPVHQDAIAGMKGRSVANSKGAGACWHIGFEDWNGGPFLPPSAHPADFQETMRLSRQTNRGAFLAAQHHSTTCDAQG